MRKINVRGLFTQAFIILVVIWFVSAGNAANASTLAKIQKQEQGLPSIEINLSALEKLGKSHTTPPQLASSIPLSTTTSISRNNAAPTLPSSISALTVAPPSIPTMIPLENPPSTGYVEAGAETHSLSNIFHNWAGQYVKGEVATDEENRWNAEFSNQKRFGDNGTYAAIGNTHTFDENWFSNINIGAGNGGVFLPRYRVDAFINRKLGDDKRLIATFGLGVYKAMETYNDESAYLGATYYFEEPFIIQGGIRFNNSRPKNVKSFSQYVAVTQGRNKEHFITLRYGFGEEAYELQGENSGISDFYSHEASLNLRQWLTDDLGFNLRGEFYHNPSYIRRGIAFGIFHEF